MKAKLLALSASVLLASLALAEVNLPVTCSDASKAGRPVNECATAAQTYARPSPSTLVRHCSSSSCSFAQRTWRALGQVPANEFVEVCAADKAPGAPIAGGNCSTSNTANDWAQMRLVPPTQVATATSSGAFQVTPQEGFAPLSATITWNVPEAGACIASGSWTGSKASSGSQTVTGLTANASYRLVCTRTATTSTGSARLSWEIPTQNTDGTALTDLAGFRIYHGSSSSALSTTVQVPNAGANQHTLEALPVGPRFFAVTAYTSAGTESTRSNVVSKTIAGTSSTVQVFDQTLAVTVRPRPDPKPPTNLVVDAPIAGLTSAPVFNVSGTGTRGSAVLGFVEVGTPCSEPRVYRYRSQDYFRVPREAVRWWASPPRDNAAAPCRYVEPG